MINPVIEYLKANFPVEKVREDLFCYLEEMLGQTFNGNEFVLEVSEADLLREEKVVKISYDDQITIYKYRSSYEFDEDLYFFVTVGLGEFYDRNKNGIYSVGKCDAVLKYNYDLSLFDIEFSYSAITELDSNHKSK